MLLQILIQTPKWVFFLFAALLWLGASQMRTREVRLGRVLGIAIGMVAFSLYGTLAAFGASSRTLPFALGAWLAGVALVFASTISRRAPAGTRWDSARQRFTLPGSAVPLALMMAIFFTKYAVAVAVARDPALGSELRFVLATCALYGCVSGAFAGRAARLWRLALRCDGAGLAGSAAAFGEKA